MRELFSDHPHSSSDLPLNGVNLNQEGLDPETANKSLSSSQKAVNLDLSSELDPLVSPQPTDNPTNEELSLENQVSQGETRESELVRETIFDSLSVNESKEDATEDNEELSLEKGESDLATHLDTVLDSLLFTDSTDDEEEFSLETPIDEAEGKNTADISEISLEKAEEATSEQEEEEMTPETDWFELACKLRGQNQELIQTVVALEQALAQARQDIHTQKQYSPQNQSSLTLGEIDNLKEENTNLKEQIAELERECAVLKEENQEKSHQLGTAEGHIKELHSRLQRQQRYTLQYKAALEQHLGESFDNLPDTEGDEVSQELSIQPWSEERVEAKEANTDAPNPEESATMPQEPSISVDVPLRSPSFQVNSSKIGQAEYSDEPEPSKTRSAHGIIDLPGFLRRRSR